MKLKSLSKISEKSVVVLISIYTIWILTNLILDLFNPNVSYAGLSKVSHVFDNLRSLQMAFSISAMVLVIIGIFYMIKQNQIRINKYFRYPIYFFFLTRIYYYLLELLHAFSEKRAYPFAGELLEAQWYDHLFNFLNYAIFILILIHFIFRKREFIKNPVEVHKLKRLFNWLLDNLHILVFVFIYGRSIPQALSGYVFESFDFSWLFLIVSFFYYFFSEILFGQTIGKIPDNSFVQYKGNRLKAIFIRTICRFIPFEPFSFLFAEKGWHDQLSNTSVVIESRSYSEEIPEKVDAENKTIEA